MIHDLADIEKGKVSLWPREKLVSKTHAMIDRALNTNHLPAGTSAKLYGLVNSFESGMFGKLGRAGLNALKDRANDRTSSKITERIFSSLMLLREVMSLRPRRTFHICPYQGERFVMASDAAYENGTGSGGFLVVLQPPPNERDAPC